ncbi:2TM domain-containing protein [Xylophilus rhododendri]|nr:2TM domain-containing protein [Xylophilus rhododendri]
MDANLPATPQSTAMPSPMTDEDLESLARRRAGAKLGWYTHALIYLVVNAVLFVLARHGVTHRPWNLYPAAGWGLGLLLHGVSVFLLGAGSGLRERLIERERQRLRERR